MIIAMGVVVEPRSGYVSKPRVASTLGKRVDILVNPERVAPVGRNRVAVELAIQFCNPGLPKRVECQDMVNNWLS